MIVLDLPRDLWFTSNDLPNMHYMARSNKAAAIRALAAIATKFAGETPVTQCRITVTASLPTARRFDPANIAGTVSKHAIDGMTDAGLWADDNSEHVVFVGFQRGPKTGTRGMYRLTFEIEEVSA
jgi:hypothetical protein